MEKPILRRGADQGAWLYQRDWLAQFAVPRAKAQLAALETIERQLLGPVAADQLPQRLVRAQAWQAARTQGDFSLVGCSLAPGFEFAGFALLADEPQVQRDWPLLAAQYPELV